MRDASWSNEMGVGGMEGCNWCPLFPEATQFTTNEGSSCHSQENTNCFIFFLNSNVQKNCARYCPVSQLIVRVQLLSGFGFSTQNVWTSEDTFDIWETYLDILEKIYTFKKHIWEHLSKKFGQLRDIFGHWWSISTDGTQDFSLHSFPNMVWLVC